MQRELINHICDLQPRKPASTRPCTAIVHGHNSAPVHAHNTNHHSHAPYSCMFTGSGRMRQSASCSALLVDTPNVAHSSWDSDVEGDFSTRAASAVSNTELTYSPKLECSQRMSLAQLWHGRTA